MNKHTAAKTLDNLAEKTTRAADRLGTRAGDTTDLILNATIGPIRSLIPVGCTRDHDHDHLCA